MTAYDRFDRWELAGQPERDRVLTSDCCGAEAGEYLDHGICPNCKEHCEFTEEDE